ncbi:DUF2860 domain-containing protein [Motilimonas cestriensis]|uniref:DUF2860 domain-containing protein n=1 Tax=Motilimonas cestriensis TaxID=2742685 RepID=A0ABS8W657_9GAMM|nr:DUF2860 domain-containing protein [Motilimonas cestriensis]MCE2594474.1 DUF2860 domain-containing protein [Motilimonas cestriensis]
MFSKRMLATKTTITLAILTAFHLPQAMARPLASEAGWGLTLNINGGFSQSTSQMKTDDDNEVTSDLNNSGQQVNSAIVFPLARLSYTFDDLKTQLFAGNSLENVSQGQFQLELGGTHQFADNSKLTLAWFPKLPSFSKTWQDPYRVNQVRNKTDQDSQGVRMAWENIGGSLFSFKYGFAKNQLDEETSGTALALTNEQRRLLDRNANYHRVTLDMLIPLGSGLFFEPALTYTLGDATGQAMRYDEYGTRLSLVKTMDKHRITGNAFYSQAKYDASNPVFNRNRQDNKWGLFAFYSYKAPFGWQDASFTLFGAWANTDSNIQFYESEMLSVAAGMAYTF